MIRLAFVVMGLAASVSVLAGVACFGGEPAASPAVSTPVPAAVSPEDAEAEAAFAVAATLEAQELERRRQIDAARLANAIAEGGADLRGVSAAVVAERQEEARRELSETMRRSERGGPGASSVSWSAWWYRPGHGDMTGSAALERYEQQGLLPVAAECGTDALHPWREEHEQLYYALYEEVRKLRRDWNLGWAGFRDATRGRLAWEVMDDRDLRLRIWVDFAHEDHEGERFYVVGATSVGELVKAVDGDGNVIECPHWSVLERSGVILVKL